MFTFNLNKDNYEIEVNEKIFIIPEFKAIWDADSKNNKKWAKRVFLYIWVGFDISVDNDYRELEQEKRIEEAAKIAFGKQNTNFTSKQQEIVNTAIQKYLELSSTPEERLLNTLTKHIDEQNDILSNINSIKKDGEIDGSYSKRLKAVLDNIESLIKRKKELEKIIKNDEGKIRGGKSESLLERGDIAVKSKFGGK